MRFLILLMTLTFMISCKSNSAKVTNDENQTKTVEVVSTESTATEEVKVRSANGVERLEKTESEWKAQLSEQEFYVLRKEGTERPFTSDLLGEKRNGTFVCKACDLDLFASDTKFKSGTGWPSFYEPIKAEHINEDTDHNLGYARTEVECNRCGGHLGHVFNDGPKPTGLRYCINGVSLAFKPEK